MKSVTIQSKKLDIITKITSIDDNILLEKILQLILTPNCENTIDK
jgi:hypothetical protein